MKLPAHYYDESGNLKSFQQRSAERKRGEFRAKQIAQQVQEQARTPVDSGPFAARIDELKARLRTTESPTERAQIKRRLNALQPKQDQYEADKQEEQRAAQFANDPLVQLARESADHIEQSWQAIYKGADPDDIQTLLAIARSDDFTNPEQLKRAYYEKLSAIEESVANQARTDAHTAEAEAHKAEAAAARANIARLEAEKRLDDARGNL